MMITNLTPTKVKDIDIVITGMVVAECRTDNETFDKNDIIAVLRELPEGAIPQEITIKDNKLNITYSFKKKVDQLTAPSYNTRALDDFPAPVIDCRMNDYDNSTTGNPAAHVTARSTSIKEAK